MSICEKAVSLEASKNKHKEMKLASTWKSNIKKVMLSKYKKIRKEYSYLNLGGGGRRKDMFMLC